MSDNKRKEEGILVRPAGESITRPSSNLVRRGLVSVLSQNPRVVSFPSECSIGRLFAIDNRDGAAGEEGDSNVEIGEARGRIHVPAGWDLELLLDDEGPADFSGLFSLKPHDLQNLVVHPRCVVVDSDLKSIMKLTGLL